MDLMTLGAKLTLDDSGYKQKLEENEKQTSGFSGKIQSAVGGLAKGVAAVGAAGAAAAVAVGKIAKSAVDGFADSQQLVGGIETLFGDNAQKVIAKANDAFKTAGLSANQYMDTTIQSAAAMISSLGGDQAKAAELMDLSITDMADNVNKMGTSMEGVQNAYRGFSRGNFTMLDNLALGYAGTKEGMQQLLDKAEELEAQQGRTTKYSIDSYADIVQAIHVVQTEMGITGTTAKEADQTISGSLASMKTAWQNLINGLADPNADMGQLIGNMVDSAKTALKNIIPAFKQALKGISQVIKEIVPIITQELPGLVDEVAPPLIEAAASLIAALITALPNLITAIVNMIPQIMTTIGTAIKDAWPAIQQAIMDGLGTTGGKVLAGVLAAWTAIKGLGIVGGISNAIGIIGPLIASIASPVGLIVAAVAAAAVAIIMNWDKIKEAWGVAVEFFKGVWSGIKNAFSDVKSWLSDKFKTAKEAVLKTWNNMGDKFGKIRDSIANKFSNTKSWLTDKFISARDNISKGWTDLATRFGKIKDAIANVFKKLPESFATIGRNLMVGMYNGIVEKAQAVIDKVKGVADQMLGFAKRILGISSPSKEFAKIGDYMMQGMAQGIESGLTDVDSAMGDMEDVIYKRKPSINVVKNASAYGSMDGSGQYFTVPRQQQARQLTVILELDRMMLGRAVYNLNNEETQRVGVKLAGGYA